MQVNNAKYFCANNNAEEMDFFAENIISIFKIQNRSYMKLKNKILTRIILLSILLINCAGVFARAGGASSGKLGLWGIILAIILLPFFLIYSGILKFFTSQRKRSATNLINKLETTDGIWNERSMSARAEEVFLSVQKAWMERNMDMAKEFVSQRLYTQTDDMITRGVKNYLSDIQLEPVTIFSVSDYKDNSKDSFSAKISGRMLDYELNESTNIVTKGDRNGPRYFEDIWTFIRNENTWIADEVVNNVSLGDITKGRAFSEG
jgi:hypothetical protein